MYPRRFDSQNELALSSGLLTDRSLFSFRLWSTTSDLMAIRSVTQSPVTIHFTRLIGTELRPISILCHKRGLSVVCDALALGQN